MRDIHAPYVASPSYTLPENSANGTVLGTPTFGDPNAGQTLALSIVSGNTGNAFSIDVSTGRLRVNNTVALDFETTPTFSLMVRVTDNGNPSLFDEIPITINLTDVNELIPLVERVSLNDGSASRSQVSSLNVTFSNELNLALLASAFAATNIDTGIAVGTVNVSASYLGGKTIAILTFAGASTVARQGSGDLGNSLADGNYHFDIRSQFVREATTNTAMVSDYLFGGQDASAANNDNFFRLLGDANRWRAQRD